MYDFKSRQKSKQKFTTIGFGPSENYQSNRQFFATDGNINIINKQPSFTGFNDDNFDRDSHHSRRSGSEKKKKKESSLLEIQPAEGTGNRRFSFEPVDVDKFKNMNVLGTNHVLPPMDRDRSETSRKSSKSKKKPKDAILMSPDVVNAPLKQPNIQNQKWNELQSNRQHVQQITYMQPQPASRKQIYDLTVQSPMQEQPSHTEKGSSQRLAEKSDKRKPKDNTLLEEFCQQKHNKPFTFGDVMNKKEVQSIPSTTQMECSEVNSVKFDGTSPFHLNRQNKFFEDSKVNAPLQRKRKEANRLGNLFQEHNKSRSIENVSKISETVSSKHRSRIGELFRERKSQQKSKIDEQYTGDNSKRTEKLQKPFGDSNNIIKQTQFGAQLCNYAKVYQAAKPLEVRMQPHKISMKDESAENFKVNTPSVITYSSNVGKSPITMEIPCRPTPFPPQVNTQNTFPSIPSLTHENSPSGFYEKNSILRYSQTPPKQNEATKYHNMAGVKESLFFNLENDDKMAVSKQKKKGLMVTSKGNPVATVVQKKDIKDASDKHSMSIKSNSHEKEKKKVKESTLETLSKPIDQKFFDFQVRNSPSKVNDSYYSDDASPLIPEPPSTRRDSQPAVITFDDESPKTYSPEAITKSLKPIVSKTSDNFYPKDQGNSSICDQSIQSANSSGIRPPYTRPPSYKKSISSKRSSSKEGSLLDSVDEPQLKVNAKGKKLTLNDVAQIRKIHGHCSRDDLESSGRYSDRSNKKKNEMCLMENCESQSKISKKSQNQNGTSGSRSREKNIMIDSSKVSEWLPSNSKKNCQKYQSIGTLNIDDSHGNRGNPRNIQERISDSRGNKSSLEEFIKPVGPLIKQGVGTFYLQQYYSSPSSTPVNDYWEQDSYEDELQERVNFNDMFDKKNMQKKCMPRTEIHYRR